MYLCRRLKFGELSSVLRSLYSGRWAQRTLSKELTGLRNAEARGNSAQYTDV